jgi:hypothetical protein
MRFPRRWGWRYSGFSPEDGDSIFLRNILICRWVYTTPKPIFSPNNFTTMRASSLIFHYVYFRSPFANESVREDDVIVGKCPNIPSTLTIDILHTTVPDPGPRRRSVHRIVGVRVGWVLSPWEHWNTVVAAGIVCKIWSFHGDWRQRGLVGQSFVWKWRLMECFEDWPCLRYQDWHKLLWQKRRRGLHCGAFCICDVGKREAADPVTEY